MARIPEHEIERLKETADLVALVEAKGVTLVRHGADLHGRCPMHDDRTPSLVVSPAKGLWHCMGACNVGGSVIDWVMRAEGVSFRHAVELLRNDLPLAAGPVVKQSTVPKLPPPVTADADNAALLAQVIDYYHDTLKQSPEALAYLEQRGIGSMEAIDRFRLGFANRTLGLRLPEKTRKAGAEVRTRLQRLGVLRESGHEHFNGSLVIPVCDAAGDVVEVYGRKITPNLRTGTPLHLYLPGPHCGVFNAEGLAGQEEVILCEALIDALTFWCAGYRNVTASYGVNGLTDEHLAAFREAGTRRVLIAYDRDVAGDAAALTLAKTLTAHGIDCYRIQFPKGMDANAYALSVQPASKSLGLVIRQAEWLGNGVAPERVIPPALTPTPVPTSALPLAAVASPVPEQTATAVSSETSTPPPMPEPPVYRVPPSEPALPVEIDHKELRLSLGDRTYTVRGIEKNLSYEQLKVWLRASRGDFVHVDTVELYQAKQRAGWIKQTAVELGASEEAIKSDLGALLRAVEQRQDELIRQRLSPKDAVKEKPAFTPEQEDAALTLLRDPKLAERIVADVSAIGVVGEDANALVGYLACVSRKLDKPLAVLIQSTSAAGKSTLMDALLSLMPEPERVHYSAMTGQSLFYLGEGDLRHKILAIAEEEGVRQAAYALKLLQSQGELTIASTGKDPTTGKLVTEEYRVEGPVMLCLTTTAIDLDEELLNRCLVLTINESREQTEAIHVRQRQARTLQGLLATKQGDAICALHQAAQTLLRPVAVVNPYAEALTFRSESTRMRRDHAKYLTLIDAIAFLHQHQRPVQTASVAGQGIEYVEVTHEDIALANRLAGEVLGRCLDELPPQTRRVLSLIVGLVAQRMAEQAIGREAVRFTRKELRAIAGITDTALRLHLERLVELEYLLVHRGGQRFAYELLFDGDVAADTPQLIGLLDVASLESASTTADLAPQNAEVAPRSADLAPRSHPENTPLAPRLQGSDIPRNISADAGASSLVAASKENPLPEPHELRRRSHTGNGVAAVR
jgi:DNA primase catalytic core